MSPTSCHCSTPRRLLVGMSPIPMASGPLLHPAACCNREEERGDWSGEGARPVSTAQLHPLRGFHRRPIKQVVFLRPYPPMTRGREVYSWGGLRAYMLSALIPSSRSYPAVPLVRQPVHQRAVPPGPLVLGRAPRKPPTPAADRDRTVSRRSEPSSRAALTGEQPDPWGLLQPQDATSRHRGAKPRRRCELLGGISLLSPG